MAKNALLVATIMHNSMKCSSLEVIVSVPKCAVKGIYLPMYNMQQNAEVAISTHYCEQLTPVA